MNHLIIFAHPNSQKSFGRAIVERIVKASQQLGVETHLRDLYTMEFNPIISFEELSVVVDGLSGDAKRLFRPRTHAWFCL